MPRITEVAILAPINQTFDYLCSYKVSAGMRVKVPFGNKKLVAIVLSCKQKSSFDNLKSVETIIDNEPIISKDMLDFLSWAAYYYHHPIGDVIASSIPKNLRLGKEATIKKDTEPITATKPCKFTTTNEQNKAINSILSTKSGYHGYLLHGITGSGKTEVYLRITEYITSNNKQALILVPEIGLTPQIITSFANRLNVNVVAIHSQLNATQKLDAYLMAKNNKAKVVLGTRSAVFTPMPNLGLIIVDEEHDRSFKQNSGFRYSARSLSFIRAKKAKALLILGSATPSLETLKNVADKKISYLSLTKRVGDATLPKISLIDLRQESGSILSISLIKKMKTYLALNKQVMLFINRRGYAPVYFCNNCAWQALCVNCTCKMVYHHSINRLKCHHCGCEQIPMLSCPVCNTKSLNILGYGTERLEETLKSYFPDVPIIRVDRDTTRKKQSLATHLKKINSKKPCVIVGTQMLAKGHNFLNLAMVGVLDIDSGLLSIDFRATEYLAQLLIQVSGRAGRDKDQGEVIIQTRYPEHPLFKHILYSHYTKFTNELLRQRFEALMPPFSYQALLCANAKNKKNAEEFLNEAANLLKSIKVKSIEIWGPVSGIIEKKAGYYYFNLYLQSTNRAALHKILATFRLHIDNLKLKNKVRWYLDIDPI